MVVSRPSRLGSDLVVFSDLPPRLWLVILDLFAWIGKVAASLFSLDIFPRGLSMGVLDRGRRNVQTRDASF